MKIIFGVLLLVMAGLAAYLLSSELNRMAALGSEGFIQSGSKFGVHIGDNRTKAIEKLDRHGIKTESLPTEGRCLGRDYPTDQQINLLRDRSWRRGVICLASRDEKIVSVAWYFSWGAP